MRFGEKNSARAISKSGKRAALWIFLGIWALLVLIHSSARSWHGSKPAPVAATESNGTEAPGMESYGRGEACGSFACALPAPAEPKAEEPEASEADEAPEP